MKAMAMNDARFLMGFSPPASPLERTCCAPSRRIRIHRIIAIRFSPAALPGSRAGLPGNRVSISAAVVFPSGLCRFVKAAPDRFPLVGSLTADHLVDGCNRLGQSDAHFRFPGGDDLRTRIAQR